MDMNIGFLHAKPGQKTSSYLPVDVGTTTLQIPVVLINGAKTGPRLTVTSGVHYAEFIGIEALIQVLEEIDPKNLRGQIVACPVVNPPVVFSGCSSNSPLDGINLNRVFPGKENGTPSERLAAWMFAELLIDTDMYVDLHGGGFATGLIPFIGIRTSGDKELDNVMLAAAKVFGFKYITRGKSPSGGNSHAAAIRAGIPSILVEIDKSDSRSAERISQVKNGLLGLFKHLDMLNINVPSQNVVQEHWVWAEEIFASKNGFWYPSFKIGEDVQKGQELGKILDPLGDVLAVERSPVDGRVFYGHRCLPISTRDVIANIAQFEN
jgi:predicted deacylase